MAKQRKEDAPPPGSPAWMATFGDLMNLLLCFFVLLFSMSSIDEQKFQAIAESFNQTFSIFNAGATSIGEGILISNGVSQLNELDEYINSTGKTADSDETSEELNEFDKMAEALEQEQLKASEELAEKIAEAVEENELSGEIDMDFNSQYVQLTLKGAILFDSGYAEIKQEAYPILDKVGIILEKYAGSTIEIEGHTDNVPISNDRYENNNVLSMYRALSVADYIRNITDLEPGLLKSSGRGEYVPIADNSTPEGRARNRRVEVKIYNSYGTVEQ